MVRRLNSNLLNTNTVYKLLRSVRSTDEILSEIFFHKKNELKLGETRAKKYPETCLG